MDEPTYRDDLKCPETDEPIPLDEFSVRVFSDEIHFVWCPDCRVSHQFNPKP